MVGSSTFNDGIGTMKFNNNYVDLKGCLFIVSIKESLQIFYSAVSDNFRDVA